MFVDELWWRIIHNERCQGRLLLGHGNRHAVCHYSDVVVINKSGRQPKGGDRTAVEQGYPETEEDPEKDDISADLDLEDGTYELLGSTVLPVFNVF